MQSLLYGLIAALAWGLHDFSVRHLSQKLAVATMLLAVLIIGSFALIPVITLTGGWGHISPRTALICLASGGCYAVGCFGLFSAFAIGPVRLVAPIGGAFPVISFALAALAGQPIRIDQWLATLAVIAGIALVARQHQAEQGSPNRGKAMAWAAIGALGFGLTFAFGQNAAQAGGELQVTLMSRLTALAIIGAWVLGARMPLRPLRPHMPLLMLMGVLDVTALGFVLAAGGLAHPEFAAVTSSVFGLITILLAWRFLREPMRTLQWSGVALVFAGIGWLAAS